jgi:hypothetical protein
MRTTPVVKAISGVLVLLGLLPVARAQPNLGEHALGFSNRNQPAEVYLNGFPVHVLPGTNLSSATLRADPYIVQGTNVFLVHTRNALTNLDTSDFASERFHLDYGSDALNRTEIFTLERLARPLETNVLHESIRLTNAGGIEVSFSANVTTRKTHLDLNADTGEGRYRIEPSAGTNSIELRVFLTNALLPSVPWQGSPVAVTPSDVTQIHQVILGVHAAFTNRNANALTNLLRLKIERGAASKGISFVQEAEPRRLFFQRLFARTPFDVAPLNAAQLTIQSYPAANLIQVLLDGRGPIVATGQGFSYRLPVYLSKLDGSWQIVE